MALFEPAIEIVLRHEGGFVDHPADPGGATNWGISLRFLVREGIDLDLDADGDLDADDIRLMPRETAIKIYRERIWDRFGYAQIAGQELATKVFDLAVNMGAAQSHKCLQRACWAAGAAIDDDGILGPVTLAAANKLPPAAVLAALRSEAAGFYRLLAATRPSLAVFLTGWLRRAYS